MRTINLLSVLALLSARLALSAPLIVDPSSTTTIPAASSSSFVSQKSEPTSLSSSITSTVSTTTSSSQNPLSPTPTPIDSTHADSTDLITEPPPLFDPWEPRPDPLFFDGPQKPQNLIKPPPLPKSRSEVLLPYDGSHKHPLNSPYAPNAADSDGWAVYASFVVAGGRSTFTRPGRKEHACGVLVRMARVVMGVLVVLMVAYGLVWAAETVLCCCVRRRRRRGQSLTARLVAPIVGPEDPWVEKERERERLKRERSRSPVPEKGRGRERGASLV